MADTVVVDRGGRSDNSGAGWIALAVIVVALIIGGIYVYRHGGARAANPTGGAANINVTLPAGSGGGAANQ